MTVCTEAEKNNVFTYVHGLFHQTQSLPVPSNFALYVILVLSEL